jgi:hypothetical protein
VDFLVVIIMAGLVFIIRVSLLELLTLFKEAFKDFTRINSRFAGFVVTSF